MKLLGVTIQSDLKWDIHVADIVSRASRRLFTLCILKKYDAPLADLVSVFVCYIRPVLEYASQVWHTSISKQLANRIENVQKRACRIMLGFHQYHSYSNALDVLGISSLETRRDTLLYNFGTKLLHSPRFRNMLPPPKLNNTTTRILRDSSMSTLVVPKCKTDRYMKSTIPVLSKLL